MPPNRVAIALCLVVATGGAACLAARWLTPPDGALLLSEDGAQWIRMATPPSIYHRTIARRRIHFRRSFSLEQRPERARLRVRAFRSGVVFVNGRRIDSSLDDLDVAAFLHPGPNRLRVVVENDRGPPALLVHSEDLDVSTPRDWWARDAASQWSRAKPVSERTPFPASREFPSVPEILVHKLHFLAAFFLIGALGSLLLEKYAQPRRVRWVLLGAWIVLCANDFWKVPIHVGFDVVSHYEYVAFILEKGRLPLASDGWAMFQPPLFYLLAAIPAALAAGRLEPDNVALLLRVLPMLCGLAQVEIAFRSSRIAFPERNDLQIIGTVVGGFLPMNLYISQTVGNEPLSGCLTALLIYCAFELLVDPSRGSLPKACGRLGLLFGLALLAKVSAIVLLPAILLLILYVSFARGSRPRELALCSTAFFGVSALVAGWYFIRNWVHYGKPFLLRSGDSVPKFDWWQDPGYRIPEHLFSFGESLTHPIFSSLMGFWDGVYSTFWLDGLQNLVKSHGASPHWNHEFMLCLALLSIPLSIAGLAGVLRALRKPASGAERVLLFSVACLGSFLAAMLFTFFTVPAYAATKSTYALGLLPCFAVLTASGIGLIPRSTTSRAIVSGYVFSWLAFAYTAYFAW